MVRLARQVSCDIVSLGVGVTMKTRLPATAKRRDKARDETKSKIFRARRHASCRTAAPRQHSPASWPQRATAAEVPGSARCALPTKKPATASTRKVSSYTHRNLLYSELGDVAQNDPDHESWQRLTSGRCQRTKSHVENEDSSLPALLGRLAAEHAVGESKAEQASDQRSGPRWPGQQKT